MHYPPTVGILHRVGRAGERTQIFSAGAGGHGRLVQAVTIDQMPAESTREWRDAAAAVIEAAIPGDPAQPETWSGFAALFPHAQAALTDDSDGISRMAAYVGHSGNYPAARDQWQRVLDMRVLVRGPEHPDTLSARASLAYWTGKQGM